MKMIVGLGNPEQRYERTRHNAGAMVVDRLVRRHAPSEPVRSRFNADCVEAVVRGERCLLMKPVTYMNRSGIAVSEAVRFYKLDPAKDVLVVTDDVALPPGSIRLRASGGAGGHNGLSDITQRLGTDVYARCRVGIGASPPMMDQADYVLGRFTEEEMAAVSPALDRAAEAAEVFAAEGIEAAMNRFNVRAEPRGRGPESKQDEQAPIDPGWTGG